VARAVSVSHTAAVERARSRDDKMRCEFLLILYPICWLHLSPLIHPKVLRRLRNEWRGTESGTRRGACARRASAAEQEGEKERERKRKHSRKERRNGGTWLSDMGAGGGNEQRPTLT